MNFFVVSAFAHDEDQGGTMAFKDDVLGALRKDFHNKQGLLSIANRLHGGFDRIEYTINEMVEEETVIRHTIQSADEHGVPYNVYVYTAAERGEEDEL